MTASTARVLALLEILQTGGVRTVGDLAGRLEVDERTVRRSVAQLIDLGIPVTSIRGRYGGYRLAPGYRMPPLMLTDNEALATLLALSLGRRTTPFRNFGLASQSASAKIRRVLPTTVARRLEALLDTADFGPVVSSSAEADAGVLLDISVAARDRHPIEIGYRDRSGRTSARTVFPYGVVAHSGRWYLAGIDTVSESMRTFRLDRITDLAQLPGSFDTPADFDARNTVIASLESTPWAIEVSVNIDADIPRVRQHFPEGIGSLTESSAHAGWTHLQLRAERLDWVASTLAAMDRPFVVDSPAALRLEVLGLAERLRGYVTGDFDPKGDD